MNVRILLENNNIHVFVCESLPLMFCNNDDNMAMMQVLVNCPSRKIIDSHYLALDLAHHIKFPGEPGQCHVIDFYGYTPGPPSLCSNHMFFFCLWSQILSP